MVDNQRLLELAIAGLEAARQRIDSEIAALRQRLGKKGSSRTPAPPAGRKPAKRKGGITAEGRRKISEMMTARWAARRAALAKKKK